MAQYRRRQRVLERTAVVERVEQRTAVDAGLAVLGQAGRAADGVGQPPQVAPAVQLVVQIAQLPGTEVGREPAPVEPFQRRTVGEQGDLAAGAAPNS